MLEDANSIQTALMEVMRLLASQQLDHKTAGLLLYALQTASSNLRRTKFEPLFNQTVIIDPRRAADRGVDETDAWSFEEFRRDEPEEDVPHRAAPVAAKRPPALAPCEVRELKKMEATVREFMPDHAPLLRSIAELARAGDG